MNAIMELRAAPSNVVLNANLDVSQPASQPATAVSALSLTNLEQSRINWETTAYRTSNQQLYAVLADCLAYGAPLPTAESKQRTAELERFNKQRGYIVKTDSPTLTRVVKAVFGNVDRRRISTYSLVLRTAQKAGVQPEALADWIEANGGIQEIKLGRSATYKSPKQKADEAKSSLATLPTLAVAKEGLALLADADFVGGECVLLAEQQADGSFHIKALTRTSTAVNAALAALYGEQQRAAN
jgi:hypothetical protein